jgi:hypothetical protein
VKQQAAPCAQCFASDNSISKCRIANGHCGTGVRLCTEEWKPDENSPTCFDELSGLTCTTCETNIPCENIGGLIEELE